MHLICCFELRPKDIDLVTQQKDISMTDTTVGITRPLFLLCGRIRPSLVSNFHDRVHLGPYGTHHTAWETQALDVGPTSEGFNRVEMMAHGDLYYRNNDWRSAT